MEINTIVGLILLTLSASPLIILGIYFKYMDKQNESNITSELNSPIGDELRHLEEFEEKSTS